jgi:hypothetical protein
VKIELQSGAFSVSFAGIWLLIPSAISSTRSTAPAS